MKSITLKNKGLKNFLDFLARVSISAIFISAIPGKITGFGRTIEYISSKGIPDPIASILLVGAIICLTLGSGFFIFGCVIKGKTAHFDLISKSVIDAIMNISIDSKKPVGNCILTCFNHKQALVRKNKGKEAALALNSILYK